MKIVIIGLGGIGSILTHNLCRYLNFTIKDTEEISLVDGDAYEAKNFERQNFTGLGNKAEVQAKKLSDEFKYLDFVVYPEYINKNNIKTIITEGNFIFMCVDNHKTRKIVSDFAQTLETVTLISGGNDFTDGNIQIFNKKEGKTLTPPLTDYHPEIQKPKDKSPEDLSCEELAASEPQLLFTNLTAATFMCQAFYNITAVKNIAMSEVYFDMLTMKTDSKQRKPLTLPREV